MRGRLRVAVISRSKSTILSQAPLTAPAPDPNNAPWMGTGGSGRQRATIPPPLALAAVVVGMLAMPAVTVLLLPRGMRTALVASELVLVTPGLLALLAYRIAPVPGLSLRPLDRRTALLVVGAGGSLWLASLGLLELQYAVWSPPPGYLEAFRRLHEALRPAHTLDAIASIVAIGIVPALCEEVLVRGIVLPSLLRATRPAAAVIVSAMVFAFIHLDPYRTLFTLVLGLALGVLRLRTGSLLACMVAHAVLNTITFAAAPFTDDPSQGLPDPRPALGLALLLAGSAATVVVVRLMPSLTRPGPPPTLGA